MVLKRNQKMSVYVCIASFLADGELKSLYGNKSIPSKQTRLAIWNSYSSHVYSIYLCFLLGRSPRRKTAKKNPAERHFPPRALTHYRYYGRDVA